MSNLAVNKKTKEEKIERDDLLIQKIAALAADNSNIVQIAAETKLSRPFIYKVMRSPKYQEEIRSIVRQKVSKLANLMVEALEKQLKEGNIEAIKVGLKALGAISNEALPEIDKSQNITVVMPQGINYSPVENALEVKSDVR